MKTKFVSKLYYSQYIYKIEFTDQTKSLRAFNYYINTGIITYTEPVIQKIIKIFLKYANEYKLRVKNSRVYCFTNNEKMISECRDALKEYNYNYATLVVFQPKSEQIKSYLLSTTNKIIADNPQYQYKITVSPLNEMNSKFYKWAKNLPKIKLANRTMKRGGYFYVRDSKTLAMCNLFLGGSVKRIEEIVSIDKIPAL